MVLHLARLALVIPLALGLSTGACRTPPAAADAAPAGTDEARAGDPKVTLLAPGRAPLRALRLELAPGGPHCVMVTTDLGISARMEGRDMPPLILPPVRMGISTAVTAVAGGHARTRTVLESAELLPRDLVTRAQRDSMNASLQRVVGLEMQSTLTPRGFHRSGSMSPPPGLDDAARQLLATLSQSLEQQATPLPAERIGVGARWQVVHTHQIQGMRVQQTTTAELVRLDGNRAEIVYEMTQRAEPQELLTTGQGTGRMFLESLSGSGKGRSRLDLRRPVPVSSELELSLHSELRLEGDEGARRVSVRTSTSTDTGPVDCARTH